MRSAIQINSSFHRRKIVSSFEKKKRRRKGKDQLEASRLFSGPRPPISRGCCRFPDRIRGSACRSRPRPPPRPPRRARNTRRGVTRIPDTKLVTSPIPTRWRGKTLSRFRPRPPWPFPPRPRRQAGKTNEVGQRNRSGNGGNSSPARPRTGRATSEHPRRIEFPWIASFPEDQCFFPGTQFFDVSIFSRCLKRIEREYKTSLHWLTDLKKI